jgi:hypothetical protein
MKGLCILFVTCVFLLGCCDDCREQVDENEIAKAIKSGAMVNIDDDMISIDGIVVGHTARAITTGCFGIPECIRLDETNRGIVKKSTDDFSSYGEAEANDPPTGVTYFSTNFYGPYWYSNGTYTAMRALITAGGGTYPGKRIGWCNNHQDRCVQD